MQFFVAQIKLFKAWSLSQMENQSVLYLMKFFVMMGDLKALIAQLDRVQVSEACGVGSSPAERTNFKK